MTPVQQLDSGEERLGLVSNHMRKASIYRGIQSTHSQGTSVKSQLKSTQNHNFRDRIRKGIETNLTEELSSVGIWLVRSNRGSRRSDHHDTTWPAHGPCAVKGKAGWLGPASGYSRL
jgi:hypothetical protein